MLILEAITINQNNPNMKHSVCLLALLFAAAGCGEKDETDITPDLPAETPQEQFYSNLFSLCGETFEGEATYPDDSDHPLVGTQLMINLSTCTSERIEISLMREGESLYATWILENREEGLHLTHDHTGNQEQEYEEEEPATGYGGYADESGSATTQYFPADEATANMIPEAAGNVWMISLNSEENQLIYYLERDEVPRFRAVFDKS